MQVDRSLSGTVSTGAVLTCLVGAFWLFAGGKCIAISAGWGRVWWMPRGDMATLRNIGIACLVTGAIVIALGIASHTTRQTIVVFLSGLVLTAIVVGLWIQVAYLAVGVGFLFVSTEVRWGEQGNKEAAQVVWWLLQLMMLVGALLMFLAVIGNKLRVRGRRSAES